MKIRESISKYHGISVMWEDVIGHQENDMNQEQLTPMELANCKCDTVAKIYPVLLSQQ